MSGEAQRIVMAGGGTSWQDLALYLIARYVGLKRRSRWPRSTCWTGTTWGSGPSPHCCPSANTDDALINRVQDWVAENYATASPVTHMVQASGLPERTFMRRFREATGLTPLDYVQALRLEEAEADAEKPATSRSRPSPSRSATRTRASSTGCSAARWG